MRNGGSYGSVSANWTIGRNSSDPSPVAEDLSPADGTVRFAAGQVAAVIPLHIVDDAVPEEAEAFVLRLLPGSVTGSAELDEPTEVSSEDNVMSPRLPLSPSVPPPPPLRPFPGGLMVTVVTSWSLPPVSLMGNQRSKL